MLGPCDDTKRREMTSIEVERFCRSVDILAGWRLVRFASPRWVAATYIPFLDRAGFRALGIVGSRLDPRALGVVAIITAAGFASVWLVASQTTTYDGRLAFTGLPALACLSALGLERWKLRVRSVLPARGLLGTILAIHRDVLSVHGT